MNRDRLLDVSFGFFQGGATVAIVTGIDPLGLVLLALATVVGLIGMQQHKGANIAETPDEDPRGGDADV